MTSFWPRALPRVPKSYYYVVGISSDNLLFDCEHTDRAVQGLAFSACCSVAHLYPSCQKSLEIKESSHLKKYLS